MIKVIIIEDEEVAVRKLRDLLREMDEKIELLAVMESVEEATAWISTNPAPDLGFFDIQLADDISFEIFKRCRINFPVVFVTAYDDYLLRSFDHNSIHYLLKPVTADKLRQVLDKLKKLEKHFINTGIRNLILREEGQTEYRKRLIVKKGMEFAPVDVSQIAYFFTEHKISFVRDFKGRTFIIDDPLSTIESYLDPDEFFRVNRQYIVSVSAIDKFSTVENGKILITLAPPTGEEVIIGKETAVRFRQWLRGNER